MPDDVEALPRGRGSMAQNVRGQSGRGRALTAIREVKILRESDILAKVL